MTQAGIPAVAPEKALKWIGKSIRRVEDPKFMRGLGRYIAEDALDLIEVEYEPLEPIVDPVAAAEDTSNLVHEALGTNIAYERTFVFGEVEKDFAEADLVIRDRL